MCQAKKRSTEHSKGNKQDHNKWLQRTEDGHKTDYQNKHYNINQKDEGTQDDRGRDGGTNFISRIKEQETRLTLQEHHDDDDIYIYKTILYISHIHSTFVGVDNKLYKFHGTYIKIVYFMTPLIQRHLILFYIEYFLLMYSFF